MDETMSEILNPGNKNNKDPEFPNAPLAWSKAEAQAQSGDIEFTNDHWDLVRSLQEYYAKHSTVNTRELHDALDEKFHAKGGIKHLYELFPGGPVAQGCSIAGLKLPPGSKDRSFGSVT